MDNDGNILHELDPQDLAKDIKGVDRSLEIKNYDVMLNIPVRFLDRNQKGIRISNHPVGQAYVHNRGGHQFKYIALGVYPLTLIQVQVC